MKRQAQLSEEAQTRSGGGSKGSARIRYGGGNGAGREGGRGLPYDGE